MREERGNEMRQMKGKISKFETREDSEDLYISGYFAVFGSDYELGQGPRRAWRTQPLTERSRMTSGA